MLFILAPNSFAYLNERTKAVQSNDILIWIKSFISTLVWSVKFSFLSPYLILSGLYCVLHCLNLKLIYFIILSLSVLLYILYAYVVAGLENWKNNLVASSVWRWCLSKFQSKLFRWNMIVLPILTTSLIHFSWKRWENVLVEPGIERDSVSYLFHIHMAATTHVFDTQSCLHSQYQQPHATNGENRTPTESFQCQPCRVVVTSRESVWTFPSRHTDWKPKSTQYGSKSNSCEEQGASRDIPSAQLRRRTVSIWALFVRHFDSKYRGLCNVMRIMTLLETHFPWFFAVCHGWHWERDSLPVSFSATIDQLVSRIY